MNKEDEMKDMTQVICPVHGVEMFPYRGQDGKTYYQHPILRDGKNKATCVKTGRQLNPNYRERVIGTRWGNDEPWSGGKPRVVVGQVLTAKDGHQERVVSVHPPIVAGDDYASHIQPYEVETQAKP